MRGNLEINGPLTGVGALLVDGIVTILGGAQLSSDNQVAILSAGSVSITGTGQGASYVQGLVYAAGADGIKLQDTTVVGTVLNAGKTGSGEGAPMQVERATVALDPRAAKFEVERGFGNYPSGGYEVRDDGNRLLGHLKLKSVTNATGDILDPPGPSYFAAMGRTKLNADDFVESDLMGAPAPGMLPTWFGLVENMQGSFWTDAISQSASQPSSTREFAIDLNKYLKMQDRLRVVWMR